MSNGSQAIGKTAKPGIGLTSLFGALGAVFRVRSPQRPHDTESSGPRGPSQFSLLKRMRKVPKFVVIVGLVLVVVLASAMVRALAVSGGCTTPTITWVGNANPGPDSWHTASNWKDNLNLNRVPVAGDHVCISSAQNTDSIVYSTGNTSVASLESGEPLTISGGTLELSSATEESKVNNLTLSGGTLTGAGKSNVNNLTLSSGTVSGAGNLTIPAGGNATWSGGSMTGTGTTLISPAARLTISGTNTKGLHDNRVLENAGEVTMSGGFMTSGNGAAIKNTGIFDINGDSDIFFNGFTPKPHFENTGTLKKSSGTDITEISTSLDNTRGTVDVTSGTLNLTGGLANFSSAGGVGTLAGGTYMIRSNSVLKFIGADIDVNAATIVLDGLGSAILDQNNSDAIDNLSDNNGSFTIRADRDLRTIGALRNDGSVTIGTGSVLTTTGEYIQKAGSTALEDTTSKLAASGARVRVQDGVMKGLGTVEPALDATGGRVQPGLSSGILKVAGNYAQGSTSTLEVEIGGAAPGSGHDQLDVGTTASLGGTLDIVTPSSFTPTGGESFTILKCGPVTCRSGQFDNVQGTNVGPGLEYQVRYNATDVTLELNTPPEAIDDTAQTDEDTPLNDIDVLSNDEDADGDSLSVSSVTQPSHGSAELDNGKVNYTPAPNYNGSDSFSYTVSDGNGGTDTADVSITVKAVNDAPVAKDDSYSTDEDTTLNVADPGVLGNDTDVDNTAAELKAVQVSGPDHGTLTLNNDGSFEYKANADYNGPDSFTYKANDGSADSNTVSVTIDVKAINDAPVATEDSYEVDEDTTLNIDAPGLLDDDTDVDNDKADLEAILVDNTTNGDLTLNADGSFSYTPDPNFFGEDSFTYKANDGQADSDVVTVSIKVNAVNDKPTADNQSVTTDEDTAKDITLTANDVENDSLTYTIAQDPTHGTLSGTGATRTYTPEQNYHGPDSFTFKVNDRTAESEAAEVSITVTPVNDAPVAKDDSLSTDEDTEGTGNVLANDEDVDGDNLSAERVANPAHGTLVLDTDGSYTYTPNTNFNGTDSFKYKANDGTTDSNEATVTITVNAVNDAPVADDQSVTTDEDNAKDLTLSASDVDENDTLTYEIEEGPQNGTLSGTGATRTYTPDPHYFGDDSFTFKANDGTDDSNTAAVSITVNSVNDAPEADDDSYNVDEDRTLNVADGPNDLLSNDTDVDGDSLTVTNNTSPAHGSVTVNANGSFTYTPNDNFNGTDSFKYKANDGSLDSNEATINITVNAVNDAPAGNPQVVPTNEDTSKLITLSATDADNDPLTHKVTSLPFNGKLYKGNSTAAADEITSANPANPVTLSGDQITYKPNGNFNGPDTFFFKANDGTTDSNEAPVHIIVSPVNDAPDAVNDSATTDEDTSALIDVKANDTDVDQGDTLTITNVTNPANGTAVVENGKVKYTPAPNYNGSDSFSYTISDGNGGTDTAEVSITVNSVNDAPVADDQSVTADEDTAKDITLGASDVENDTLSYSVVSGPQHGTLSGSGANRTYTPDPHYFREDSFTFKANDGSLDSNEATVNITVNSVNDAPVAEDDTAMTDEDTSALIDVLSNDEDVDDGDTLSVSSFTQPSHGQVSLDSGKLRYEPTLNYNGPDSFTYKAKDASNAESNEAKVNITVKAVNDAPTCQSVSIETGEDTQGSVAADCSDVDADTITYEIVDQATDGTASADGGNLNYDPNANFNGSDSFTYRASDGIANSEAATVDVKVNAVNDAPVAKEESYSTDEDNTLNINAPGVLSNDTDVDNTAAELQALQVSGPAHGTLTLNNSGSFEYKPEANYNGPDSFTYKANDGTEDSNLATVSITVSAVNDAPLADDQSVTTDEDTPKEIALSATDVDEGDNLTYHVVSGPAHGTLSGTGANVTYTPDADFFGEDSFTFSASDGNLDSNVATVSITVNAVNDAPVPEDNNYNTPEDTPLIVGSPGLLGNDTDVEQDPLHVADGNADTADGISPVSGPANGTLELHEDGSFTYTPTTNYHGTDSFDYRVCDNGSPEPQCSVQTATVNVTIDPVNDDPEAANDANSTDEDTTLNVAAPGVLGNDSDVEDDPLTAVKVTEPAHGTLTLDADGSYTYTPNTNFNGTDSFKYKANDRTTDSNEATVTITVNAVNDAPGAADDTKTTNEDTPLTFPSSDLVSNDDEGAPDEVAQDLTVTQVFDGTHGTVSLGTDGNITFTPETNFSGDATFTYRVCDNGSPSECSEQTATVNVTVNAVNDAPDAVDDTATTDEDTAKDIALITNDTDVDNTNAQLSVSSFSQPSHGQVTQNADGTLKYTPAEDYNGPDSFTYNATDGTDDSNTATVSITVNSVNDAPVADDQSVTTDENAPQDITLGASDVENDILSYSVVAGPQHGTLSGTGANLTYTPNADYNGPDSFTFKVNDATDDSNTATVSITVNAITPPPVADDQEVTTEEDTPKDITLTANDVDGDSLTYSIVQGPTHGTLSGTGANLTYTPEADYNGPDSFAFKANDGNADSNVATVIITVTPVNDAPVAVDDTATTDEDTPVEILAADLFENDSTGPANESDQTLRISAVSGATDGSTAEINGAGNVLFTPATNFNGTASFNYTVCDDGTPEECYEGTATVLVTVSAVNDAPLAEDQSVTTDEDTAKDITLGATDVEKDTLSYSVVAGPQHGTLSGTGANFTYTPAHNYNGPDSFTFKANDGHLDSNVATVDIAVTPVNDDPVAEGDSYDTNQDTALNVAAPGVLANDTDADDANLTAVQVSGPSHGTLNLNANGSFSYTPNADYSGLDSFTYKANDGTADSNTVTVSITVKPVVDTTAPTVVSVNPSGQAGVSTTTDITVTFSEKMDETTLNDNTVRLVKPGKKPTSIPMTMTKTTDGSGRTVLTLNPFGSAKQNLAANTTYQLTIEGAGDGDTFAVKDLAGNVLAQEAVSSITTARK